MREKFLAHTAYSYTRYIAYRHKKLHCRLSRFHFFLEPVAVGHSMCAQIEVPKKQHIRHFLRKCKGPRKECQFRLVMLALVSWRHLLKLPRFSANISHESWSVPWSVWANLMGESPVLYLAVELPAWKSKFPMAFLARCRPFCRGALVVQKVHSWCHYEHEVFEAFDLIVG